MHRAIYAGCHNALRGRQNAFKSHQNASGGHQNASRGHQNAQKCPKMLETVPDHVQKPSGIIFENIDFWRFLAIFDLYDPVLVISGSDRSQKCPKMPKSAQKCPKVPKSAQKCPKVHQSMYKNPQGSKHRFLAIFGDFSTFMTQFWSFPGQIGQKMTKKPNSAQTCLNIPNMPQKCPKACTKTLRDQNIDFWRFLAIFDLHDPVLVISGSDRVLRGVQKGQKMPKNAKTAKKPPEITPELPGKPTKMGQNPHRSR